MRGASTERCVGLLGLEEDVKARLGYDPFVLEADVWIEGLVIRQAGGFRAEIVIRDANGVALGTRELASQNPDCRSLSEAVAVAITVGGKGSEGREGAGPNEHRWATSTTPTFPSHPVDGSRRGYGSELTASNEATWVGVAIVARGAQC